MFRVVFLLLIFIEIYLCSTSTIIGSNPFISKICSTRICSGFEKSGLNIWVYNSNSYYNGTDDNKPDSIDDDDYINIIPKSLDICSDPNCNSIQETINLQNLTITSSSYSSINYNGQSAENINYTLTTKDIHNNTISINLFTYMLQHSSEIYQSTDNIDVPENDFIMVFNVTYNSIPSQYAYRLDIGLYNQQGDGLGYSTSDDGYGIYQYDDSDSSVIGYALNTPNNGYDSESFIFINVNQTLALNASRIIIPECKSFSYTIFISSGHPVHIGWAITLSILGAIAIFIILLVGCFAYFFKKRKRSIADIEHSYGSIQESDNDNKVE